MICEKPLVGSLAEVDSLAGLAKECGRQVMPIFQYRFGQGLQKLKYLVDQSSPAKLSSLMSMLPGGGIVNTIKILGAGNVPQSWEVRS